MLQRLCYISTKARGSDQIEYSCYNRKAVSAAELAVFDISMRSLARVNSSLAFCLRKYKSSPFEDYTDLSSLYYKKLNTITLSCSRG